MANRYLYQFRGSFEAGIVTIYAKISFGASGAPTLVSNECKGISSIVRNSAGNYTINLMDPYVRTLMAEQKFLDSSAPAASSMYIVQDNVSSNPGANIVIQLANGSVATDPASGEVMLLRIDLKNSSV